MSDNQEPTGLGIDGDGLQLELFASDRAYAGHRKRGVAREVALASISRGWWPLVSVLFSDRTSDIIVEECREVDGVLMLSASIQGTEEQAEWVEPMLQRLRDAASRTCGCCGRGPAARTRVRLDGPAWVACDECRRRLRAGETPLSIADQYWRLDGTRRHSAPGDNSAQHGRYGILSKCFPTMHNASADGAPCCNP